MKRRLVAITLFLMVLINTIPALSVVASGTGEESLSVDEAVGVDVFPSLTFDFSNSYTGSGYLIAGELTNDASYGLTTNGGYWRYTPVAYYMPVIPGERAVTFRAKPQNANSDFYVIFQGPAGGNARGGVSIKTSGIDAYFATATYDAGFVPGEDWVDYLLVADTLESFSLYAKNVDGNSGWTLILQGNEFNQNGGQNTGIYFSGYGHVRNLTIYQGGVSQYAFAFNSEFDTNMAGVTAPEGAEYTDANGLDLTCTGDWKYLPESGWSPLSNGKIVVFSAKLEDSTGVLNLQLANPDTLLTRKAYLDIRSNRVDVLGSSTHVGYAAATNQFSFSPGTVLNEYMVKANNDETYSVYVMLDGAWELLAKTEGYTDSSVPQEVGVKFNASGSGGYIKDLRIYSTTAVADGAAKPATETQAYYAEDFMSEPAYANGKLSETASVNQSQGVLALTESGMFELKNSAIPLGGYAEFKVQSGSGSTTIKLNDGSKAVTLALDDAYDSVNGEKLSIAEGGNVWRIWRIVREQNGNYYGYCRTEADAVWYPAFGNLPGVAEVGNGYLQITQSEGSSVFDYIKIYGPATGNAFVLTDGGGTKLVAEDGKLTYPNSLSAVVEANTEKDRILIFVEYGESNTILNVKIADIFMSDTETMVLHSVESGEEAIRKVKVFLWDNFIDMNPMGKSRTTKGDVVYWTNGWNYDGNAQDVDGVIILNPEDASIASAETELELGTQFVLSWEMMIEKFGGSEKVEVRSDSYSASFMVSADKISVGSKTIPCNIGNTRHTYRIVGNGSSWDLYLDGNLVCDLDGLTADATGAGFKISNSGSGSKLSLSDLKMDTYHSLEDPIYSEGFDSGVMEGWTQNELSFTPWSSADGVLRLENPSYDESKIKKSIELGEDFVLESRIRIENFGNWFGLRLYGNGRYLNAEIHDDFLTLVTPVEGNYAKNDQVAISDGISLNPEQWYRLKVASYDGGKYARIYLNDTLILEEEMATTSDTNHRIEFFGVGCHVDSCIAEIDWVRYQPLEKQTIGTLAPQALSVENDSIGAGFLTDSNGVSLQFSNEISYTVSGAGTAEFKNGNHYFKMTHSAESVTCLTDAGDETYSYGTGKYHVITDGPIAEVYYNGKFAFSYYMPRTTDAAALSVTGSVADGTVSATPERKNYFASRNVGVGANNYELADLPYAHNLDFVAGVGEEVHLGINDGYYRTDVSIENGKLYVWDSATNYSIPEKTEVATVSGKAYYRVETSGGMSRLYQNGRWVTTFRGGRSVGSPFLAVDVIAGELSYLAISENSDVYLYEDSFGNGESTQQYWNTSNGMGLSVANNTMVLNAEGKTNAIAELTASAGNFDLSADVTVSLTKSIYGGGFWFLLNHAVTNTYTKAGYSSGIFGMNSQYQLADRPDSDSSAVTKTGTGSLKTGKSVHMDLKVRETVEGKKVTLVVDGTTVLDTTSTFDHRGKIGFIMSNGTATFSNVSYRGDAKPVPNVRNTVLPTTGTMWDLIENDTESANKGLYLVNYAGGYKTTDGGESWTPLTAQIGFGLSSDPWPGWGGWNNNMVQLENGKVISMVLQGSAGEYGKNYYVYRCFSSDDYGVTWKKEETATLQPGNAAQVGIGATVNAVKQGASGRIYFVHGNGASEDVGDAVVWYSDNMGQTWTHSITIDGEDVGHVMAESVVIETWNGNGGYDTRLYFRNEKGYLCYYSSPDRGVNWDLENLHKTPIISSMACFNIEADPDDANTLYVGWIYDNVNTFGRQQWPRTRWGLAKSVDGGDTWEFLGTVHENNSKNYTSSNLSLNVSKDYILMGYDSVDDYAASSSSWKARVVMVDKDGQPTSKRFEQLRTMHPEQINNTRVIPEERLQKTLAVNPESGTVLLCGNRMKNKVSGEYLSLDVAEAFVGSSITMEEDAITSINGESYVKLSAFVEQFGLSVVEEGGVSIISENGDWSDRQKKAFLYAVD